MKLILFPFKIVGLIIAWPFKHLRKLLITVVLIIIGAGVGFFTYALPQLGLPATFVVMLAVIAATHKKPDTLKDIEKGDNNDTK